MTTLYLPSTGAAAVSPNFHAEWDRTTEADSLAAVTDTIGSALTTITRPIGVSAAMDVLARQYVFPLLAGVNFLTSDTVQGQIRAAESSASFDMRAQIIIR